MKMIQTLLRILALSVVFAAPSVSQAALNAYMFVEGDVQGVIEGDATQTGRENMIEVVSVGYNVSQTIDAASGLPSGKRQHRPVRILKAVDKSSPKLFLALTNGENLKDVIIRFWRPDNQSGAEQHYYTIQLINASVISISPSHSSIGDSINAPMREAVSFSFQRIIITDEINGIEATDDWVTGRI